MYEIKSESEYKKKKNLIDSYEKKAKDMMYIKDGKYKNYLTPEEQAKLPNVTNADRSAVETYEFKKEKPEKYVAYVDEDKNAVTTWTGQKLGKIYDKGDEYRGGFNSTRQNIKFKTDDGTSYSGVYYKSAGDYASFKKLKNK